jgi:transposase
MVRRQNPTWLGAIKVVATDLTEHYRAGLRPHLDHTLRVADPFHVIRAANRCVDKVRRRVQNECHEEAPPLSDSIRVVTQY